MLDTQTKIILTGKFDLIDLAGEQALFDFETGSYYILKGSADAIWEHIRDGMSVGELSAALTADFDIDIDTCMSAISDFLSALGEQHFIELAYS